MEKQIRVDIRMNIVEEEIAMQYLNNLVGNWIYIKHLNNTYNDDETEQVTTYTKMKVRNVDIGYGTILIYGIEDEDRLVIDMESIVSYQMTPIRDELFIQIATANNRTDVYIKHYLPNIKNRLNEILDSNQNLIITEGKTDWKHLKRALSYLQERGLYRDIKFTFFEYEDEIDMGADTLLKVLEYNQLFYSTGIKIFIFDADREDINKKHEGKEFLNWGNNVYSFIIPVPDFRKKTPLISIEHYYTDKEIKTCDTAGRRLYLNNEFNFETGRLKDNARIFNTQYKKYKKISENHIIDDEIFDVPEKIEICDKNIYQITKTCKNVALPKNHFANHILKAEKPFDKICFDSFKLIFDIISKIQDCPKKGDALTQQNCINEVEISHGIYIRTFSNSLKTLEIYVEETEQAMNMEDNGFLNIKLYVEKNTNTFNIILCNDAIGSFNILIPLSVELLMFLQEKVDNQYNRIELHFVNKEKYYERIVEILNDSIAGGVIERELSKLYEGI